VGVNVEKRPTSIRPEKVAVVEDLADRLSRATMAVLADYRGLTVSQISELRRQLRAANVEMRVAKNTLARLAAQRTGREALLPALEGPTAFVFTFGDPAAMAKALTETIRTQRLDVRIKSALYGEQLLPPADVTRIAELPPRDVLIAQVVGAVQSPISSFVNVLAATLQSLVGVLEARRQQMEGEAA
jgi:large subunit ribosomal protein L10